MVGNNVKKKMNFKTNFLFKLVDVESTIRSE